MRTFFLVLTLMASSVGGASASDSPVSSQRLSEISTAAQAGIAEKEYLMSTPSGVSPDSVIATAGLYRHWPAEFESQFVELFAIDRMLPALEISAEQVNREVNELLQQLKGRHPMEVSARLYLAFRQSGKFVMRGGDKLFLEVMFRGSVFTGISGGSQKRVLELAAVADGKSPNQPTETTHGK